jgi:hypothetical protein
MHEDAIQQARTESTFREVNERIAENARRFDSGDTAFICECSDPHCTEKIRVSLVEYERVRGDGARFLLAPGHGNGSIERVVVRGRSFQIVEKVHRGARALVRLLNPRAAET